MSLTADDSAPDFDLPEQILSVIPSDPYDQLDLARKITSMAIASRVSKLESETSVLRQRVCDQDRLVFELQDRVSSLQQSSIDADSRLKSVLDENLKLTEERDSFAATVKRLSRDVSKLETFKRQLMQSLSEDTASSDTVDIGTCDQAVPRAYQHEGDSTNGYRRYHSFTGPATSEVRLMGDEASKANGQRFSMTPYQITPRLTPTGTPKIVSATGSPKAHSTVGSPPKNSGATTPTEMSYDGRISLSSYYPSSKQSSAANSPPRGRALPGRTPRIDGKEFFRQARSRLSYEQFSAFLANIKEFNAQKQTREETLRKAEEIFGTYNKDLYLSFQGLLNRNVH